MREHNMINHELRERLVAHAPSYAWQWASDTMAESLLALYTNFAQNYGTS